MLLNKQQGFVELTIVGALCATVVFPHTTILPARIFRALDSEPSVAKFWKRSLQALTGYGSMSSVCWDIDVYALVRSQRFLAIYATCRSPSAKARERLCIISMTSPLGLLFDRIPTSMVHKQHVLYWIYNEVASH